MPWQTDRTLSLSLVQADDDAVAQVTKGSRVRAFRDAASFGLIVTLLAAAAQAAPPQLGPRRAIPLHQSYSSLDGGICLDAACNRNASFFISNYTNTAGASGSQVYYSFQDCTPTSGCRFGGIQCWDRPDLANALRIDAASKTAAADFVLDRNSPYCEWWGSIGEPAVVTVAVTGSLNPNGPYDLNSAQGSYRTEDLQIARYTSSNSTVSYSVQGQIGGISGSGSGYLTTIRARRMDQQR